MQPRGDISGSSSPQEPEQEKLEEENLGSEELETKKLETEKLEEEKLETGKLESVKLESVKLAQQLGTEKLESVKLATEKLETEELEDVQHWRQLAEAMGQIGSPTNSKGTSCRASSAARTALPMRTWRSCGMLRRVETQANGSIGPSASSWRSLKRIRETSPPQPRSSRSQGP